MGKFVIIKLIKIVLKIGGNMEQKFFKNPKNPGVSIENSGPKSLEDWPKIFYINEVNKKDADKVDMRPLLHKMYEIIAEKELWRNF
jgi:hypothetical protein